MENLTLKTQLEEANKRYDRLCMRHRELEKSFERSPEEPTKDITTQEFRLKQKNPYTLAEYDEKSSQGQKTFQELLNKAEFEYSTRSEKETDGSPDVLKLGDLRSKSLERALEEDKKIEETGDIDGIEAAYITESGKHGLQMEKPFKDNYMEKLKKLHLESKNKLVEYLYEDFLAAIQTAIEKERPSTLVFQIRMEEKKLSADPEILTLIQDYKE